MTFSIKPVVISINVLLLVVIASCGGPNPISLQSKEKPALETEQKANDKNSFVDGYHEEFWPNGNLSTAGYYKNGKANGLMKWHHEDGILVAEGNMIDDKRNGPWKICDIHDHTECIQANFNMDVREGLWKVFHDNGQLHKAQNWANDKMISQLCWNEMGKEMDCG